MLDPTESDAVAQPPAPRRRRAARPAGPPAVVTEVIPDVAPNATGVTEPAAEPAAPVRRSRARSAKPVTAAGEKSVQTSQDDSAQAPLVTAAAATEPSVAAEEPPAEPAPRRTRRRVTRPAAPPDPLPEAPTALLDPTQSAQADETGSPQSGDPRGLVNPQSARPQELARGRSPQSGVATEPALTSEEAALVSALASVGVGVTATDPQHVPATQSPTVDDAVANALAELAAAALVPVDVPEAVDEDAEDDSEAEMDAVAAALVAAANARKRQPVSRSLARPFDVDSPDDAAAQAALTSLVEAISLGAQVDSEATDANVAEPAASELPAADGQSSVGPVATLGLRSDPPVDTEGVDTEVAERADAGQADTERADAGDVTSTDEGPDAGSEDTSDQTGSRRRRRRGGRRRRRGGEDPTDVDADDEPSGSATADTANQSAPADADSDTEATEDDEQSTTRRRRRRRRRADTSDGDPGRMRTTAETAEEVTGISGSTRMEAKRQRRKEGRAAGRRRTPMLSEAEFLSRRESVKRQMLIRQRDEYTQIAVLEDSMLVEHYVDRPSATSLIGNIYLGRVQNVLPSMEAAFVDIGRSRNAVLYAGEVDWDSFGVDGESKRVEKVFKSGQSVLVQVTKDPVGAKGARLTSHVSLPGRFIVYSPGGHLSGISRKLPVNERERLKSLLGNHINSDSSFIVRTAAEGADEDELVRDVNRLQAQWEIIEKKSARGPAPQLLYAEPDLTLRIVRDLFTEDFGEVIVDGFGGSEDAFDTVRGYVEHVAPTLVDRVSRWDSTGDDVFAKNRVDEQIAKALERKVFLPSGGSLIIDRTEAMTVIDVNTGKFTGNGGNLEATVTSNNLEAAEEIVRQLRLRDIGGIIVVDFIDMILPSNRELLLRRLVECLGRDRTRHQVAEVTSLGLVQMTRKRIGTGLAEAFTVPCETCQGRGYHRHDQPVAEQAPPDGGERNKKGRKSQGKGKRKLRQLDSADSAQDDDSRELSDAHPEFGDHD